LPIRLGRALAHAVLDLVPITLLRGSRGGDLAGVPAPAQQRGADLPANIFLDLGEAQPGLLDAFPLRTATAPPSAQAPAHPDGLADAPRWPLIAPIVGPMATVAARLHTDVRIRWGLRLALPAGWRLRPERIVQAAVFAGLVAALAVLALNVYG